MDIRILPTDWSNPTHCAAAVALLNEYSQDPYGGSAPLSEEVQQTLADKLAMHPGCYSWLAFAGEEPVGILNSFLGFSTFQARPLLNIHDVAVLPGRRGGGIGRKLLAAAEETARQLGCCRISLEVRQDNAIAKHLYQSFGFDPGEPLTEFWAKKF